MTPCRGIIFSKRLKSRSPFSPPMIRDSCFSLSNTTRSSRCIKNTWPPFGLLIRSISIKIWEIGRNWMRRKGILSNMFWHFSRQVMGLFWRTWQNNFVRKCRFLRPGASMVSRLPWKMFTPRPILCLLTPISKTPRRKAFYSTLFPTLRSSKRKPIGQWNGWIRRILSRKD